jgi:hypothetical protein
VHPIQRVALTPIGLFVLRHLGDANRPTPTFAAMRATTPAPATTQRAVTGRRSVACLAHFKPNGAAIAAAGVTAAVTLATTLPAHAGVELLAGVQVGQAYAK